MAQLAGIVFSAFEPSGDARAAPVIEALRSARPEIEIWGLGGPRMQAAGAELIECTTDDSVMLDRALLKVSDHLSRLRRLKRWFEGRHVLALVAVDSPAANWSVCELTRRRRPEAKIIHLVAPQLWAWAPWRIRKLRRLTDHVLCLLPFEPTWFSARGVSSSFVGDPLIQPNATLAAPSDRLSVEGGVRLAMLPGSRPSDVSANWPTMLDAFKRLRQKNDNLSGRVAAINQNMVDLIERLSEPRPHGLDILADQVDAVLAWSDLVLVKSGTASLHVAAAGKPMVIIYNVARWKWQLVGRWLLRGRSFTLPNLIAESQGLKRPVPELVPHFGQVEPVVRELSDLIRDPLRRQTQQQVLLRIADLYRNHHYASEASARILQLIAKQSELTPSSSPSELGSGRTNN